MKSDRFIITSEGYGVSDALALTEAIGREQWLDKKGVIRLRLLAEELFGLLRGIAGDVRANYWLSYEEKSFELHMKADVSMSDEMKAQFLAASSSGENAAAKGFMGKLRVTIAGILLSTKEALPFAMMNTAAAYATGLTVADAATVWSMAYYKDEIRKEEAESEDAREAWDELEKSIVANVADDVQVKVAGSNVEIIVFKTF